MIGVASTARWGTFDCLSVRNPRVRISRILLARFDGGLTAIDGDGGSKVAIPPATRSSYRRRRIDQRETWTSLDCRFRRFRDRRATVAGER